MTFNQKLGLVVFLVLAITIFSWITTTDKETKEVQDFCEVVSRQLLIEREDATQDDAESLYDYCMEMYFPG